MEELKIIYEHGQPHGIRDKGGFLFFFPTVSKYTGQEERYRAEVEELYALADYLLLSLEGRNEEEIFPGTNDALEKLNIKGRE